MKAAGVWEVLIEAAPKVYARVNSWLEERGHAPAARLITTDEALAEGDWEEGVLSVFIESEEAAASLAHELIALDAGLSVTTRFLSEDSWRHVWDESVESFATERFVVSSSAEAAEGKILVRLDPSEAFGDGKHVTTRLTLAFLDTLLQTRTPSSILDVGCGNGVLGIVAALAGASVIVATDVVEEAVEATRRNAALNGISIDVRLDPHPFDGRTFEWVVANIPAAGLIALMSELKRSLAPGGLLILAGFFTGDAPLVEEAAASEGLTRVASREESGWTVLSFREGI